MEKRLPLALLLSFLILMAWTWLHPPQERPSIDPATGAPVTAPGETSTPGLSAAPDAPQIAQLPPAVAPVVADSEERETVLMFGSEGQPGYYHATFSNRGASLVELRCGNHLDHAGLLEEERSDPEHWVRLIESFETPEGATRSMLLRADSSAQALQREPIESALWRTKVLGEESAPRGIEFDYSPGTGVRLVKRFLFDPARPSVDFELEIHNESAPELSGERQFFFTPAAGVPANSGDKWWKRREPQAVAAGRTSESKPLKVKDVKAGDEDLTGPIKYPGDPVFAGAQNKYFAVLMFGASENARGRLLGAGYRRLFDQGYANQNPEARAEDAWRQVVCDVSLRMYVPEPGRSETLRYTIYAGPKDPALMAIESDDLRRVIDRDMGMFAAISRLLLVVLSLLERVTGNWGVAIILLTILVRSALFPVNRRSQTAMARYQTRMKRLQPKLEEIKERWKSDPQRQRQEQAKFMQEEQAFPPLGGCLPMFVQLPIFFGLYRALGTSVDLRQAPFFGWIKDLSLPDQLMRLDLDTHLPVIGTIDYLNLLPPIMVVLWIWQQHGMPKPADEQAARMQKMMMWMPLMMGFVLYNYAAGLSLYMITTSGLGVVEQKVIKKYWPVDTTEPPKTKKKKSGFMAKLQDAQKQQMKRMEDQKRQKQKGSGKRKQHR